MSKAKTREFQVEAKICLAVGVNIHAQTLEAAMEHAKQMKLDQFVDILGDHNNSNFRISAVFECSGIPEA